MKKNILVLILFQFFVQSLIAQNTCSYVDPTADEEKAFQKILRQYSSQIKSVLTSTTTIYIPIQVIIIESTTGVRSTNMVEVHKGLAVANQQFKESNIQLYLRGDASDNPKIIVNDSLNNDLASNYNKNLYLYPALARDAHNLVFQNTIPNAGGYSYGTTHDFKINRTMYRGGQVNDGKIIAHEMGHWMSLAHTFSGSANATLSNRELVTRNLTETLPRLSANCATKGDFLCDTPADPYDLVGGTITNCSAAGVGITVTDRNGDNFVPIPTNIMSYYFCSPQTYTPNQNDRMLVGYAYNNTPSTDLNLRYTLDAAEVSQPALTNITVANVHPTLNLGAQLSWVDNSNVETGYIIDRATNINGPWQTIVALDKNITSYQDVSGLIGQTYFYKIRYSNSKQFNSNIPSVTLNKVCGPVYSRNCTTNSSTDDLIFKDMAGNTIYQKLDAGCSPNNYGDYTTSDTLKLLPSTDYQITYGTGYSGGFYAQHVGVWIDLNNDGDFTDAGELIYQSNGNVMSGTTQIKDTLTTPAGSYFFPMRLRLRSHSRDYGPVTDPCLGQSYGETDDYTVSMFKCETLVPWNSDFNNQMYTLKAKTTNGKITANNKVDATSRINFEAASIELNPGFQTQSGAVFKAEKGGCN